MEIQLPLPGLYRHYKGDTYQLLCVARKKDFVTAPLPDKGLFKQGATILDTDVAGFQIVYYNLDVGSPWIQDLSEFFEPVWVEEEGTGEAPGYRPRFTLIQNTAPFFPTI